MTDLTLTLNERFAEKLERLAREREIGVGELVESALRDVVEREEARKRLRSLVERTPIALAPDRRWSREDTYDRPMLHGYQRPPLRGGGTP